MIWSKLRAPKCVDKIIHPVLDLNNHQGKAPPIINEEESKKQSLIQANLSESMKLTGVYGNYFLQKDYTSIRISVVYG